MDKAQRTVTLLIGYPRAVFRGLYRDRVVNAMIRYVVLILFAYLMGNSFSDSLAARSERLEDTLAQAEMPRKQMTAISAILDDIAYEVRSFVTWLVVMTAMVTLNWGSDRVDRATSRRKDISPRPET